MSGKRSGRDRASGNKSIKQIVEEKNRDKVLEDLPLESKYELPDETEESDSHGDVSVLAHKHREDPVEVPEKLKPRTKEEEPEEEENPEKPDENNVESELPLQDSDAGSEKNGQQDSNGSTADDNNQTDNPEQPESFEKPKRKDDGYVTFNIPFPGRKKKKSSGKKAETIEPEANPQQGQTDAKLSKETGTDKPQTSSEKKPKKKKKKVSTGRLMINFLVKLLVIVLAVWVLCNYVIAITINYGKHMHPAVDDGELVVSLRLDKPYLNGVVIYEHDGKMKVGRVVGLSGSEIDITELGELKVNGVTAAEEVFYPTFRSENSDLRYPVSVNDGQAFILNDYREDTNDSRTFGLVPLDDIKGPVIFSFRRRGF